MVNTYQQLKINYDSLGSPSCGLVQFSSSKYINNLGTYGDTQKCRQYFPGYTYNGPYVTNNGSWLIFVQFSSVGLIQMNITMKNIMTSLQIQKNIVSALTLNCRAPTVNIANRSALFYQPTIYTKSQLIVIETSTVLNCGDNMNNFIQWTIYSVDATTGDIKKQINLQNNPTLQYSELVIQPGVLTYGLYKFVFTVTMDISIYSNSIDHYVKIEPTGIVVFTMKGGVAEITRGYAQDFVLNPIQYSFDLDNIVSGSSLNYKFFCQSVDNGIANGFPMSSFTDKIDLMSFQQNLFPKFKMSINKTCFSDPCNY